MNFDRQKRLTERLLEKTRAGELDWQESPASEAFQVSFTKYSTQISHAELGNDDLFRIEIIDKYGRIAESFSDQDLRFDGENYNTNWYSIMNEIFNGARRRVLGADEALDSILLEIN